MSARAQTLLLERSLSESQLTPRAHPGEGGLYWASGLCIWAFSGWLWEEANKGCTRVVKSSCSVL